MKKNVGNIDKAIRLVVAAILTILLFTKTITGTWAIVAIILTAIMVLTSLVSFCPLYMIPGINTDKEKKTV